MYGQYNSKARVLSGIELTPLGEFNFKFLKLSPNQYLKTDNISFSGVWGYYAGAFKQRKNFKLSWGIGVPVIRIKDFDLLTNYKIKSKWSVDSTILKGNASIRSPFAHFRIILGYGMRYRKVNLGVFAGINGIFGKYKLTKMVNGNEEITKTLNALKNELNGSRLSYSAGLQLNGLFSRQSYALEPVVIRLALANSLPYARKDYLIQKNHFVNLTCLLQINMGKVSQREVLNNYRK